MRAFELSYPSKYEIEIEEDTQDCRRTQRDYLRMIQDTESCSPYGTNSDARFKMVFMCLSGDVESLYMSLGVQILGSTVSLRNDNWAVERAFLPSDSRMIKRMVETGEPVLTVETRTSIRECDILGLSCSNPAEYLHLAILLRLSGIPVRTESRSGGFDNPVLVVGGPGIGNPAPIQEMVDVFVYGMGEGPLGRIVRWYEDCRETGSSRNEFLVTCNRDHATFVPIVEEHKEVVASSESDPIAPLSSRASTGLSIAIRDGDVDILVPPRNLAVLAGRGCTKSCGFCLYTQLYGGHTSANLDKIIEECRSADGSDFKRVYLLDSDVAHYADGSNGFSDLVRGIGDQGYRVDLTSLRADYLTEEMLDTISGSCIAIAPEVANDFLRRRILLKTGPSNAQVSSFLIEVARRDKFRSVTFYCIIGLPTERDEDIIGLAGFADEALELSEGHGRRFESVMLSVNPLFPTPHTPLEFVEMMSYERYRKKLSLLMDSLSVHPEVEIYSVGRELFNYQRVLQRGDQRLGNVMLSAVGAVFDATPTGNFFEGVYHEFIRALEASSIPFDEFAGPYGIEKEFHWGHIGYPTRRRLSSSKKAIMKAIESRQC